MRTATLAVLLFWLCGVSFAQSSDAVKYSPRAVLLLSGIAGEEGVMPMSFTENGQTRWEYVPASKIQEAINRGGKPLHMGDILSAVNEASQKINQLQAENDKLWKVAMKSDAVIVQSSAPAAPSQAEIAAEQQAEANARRAQVLQMWMALQGVNRAPQPYQLPMPVNPNANRLQTNCTTYRLGDITHTSCN